MSTKTKGLAFEKLTPNAHKPKPEFETFGQAVVEVVGAILMVGVGISLIWALHLIF